MEKNETIKNIIYELKELLDDWSEITSSDLEEEATRLINKKARKLIAVVDKRNENYIEEKSEEIATKINVKFLFENLRLNDETEEKI